MGSHFLNTFHCWLLNVVMIILEFILCKYLCGVRDCCPIYNSTTALSDCYFLTTGSLIAPTVSEAETILMDNSHIRPTRMSRSPGQHKVSLRIRGEKIGHLIHRHGENAH